MATVGAIAALGAAGFSAWSSSSSAKKQQKNVDKQIKEARRIRAENMKISDKAFTDIESLIKGVPSLQSFLEEGGQIADEQRQDRLGFVLGDSLESVREAQQINAKLGAFDFTNVNNAISNILKSNFFDIASITRDAPEGAFANLSVQNMANLAQQGISNTINIGDFISRVSGVDQFNPYRIAQDLFTIERDKSSQLIQNVSNDASRKIGLNQQWFKDFSELSSAKNVIESTRNAAMISAVNSAAGAIGGWANGVDTQKMQDKQMQLADSQIAYYQNLAA